MTPTNKSIVFSGCVKSDDPDDGFYQAADAAKKEFRNRILGDSDLELAFRYRLLGVAEPEEGIYCVKLEADQITIYNHQELLRRQVEQKYLDPNNV